MEIITSNDTTDDTRTYQTLIMTLSLMGSYEENSSWILHLRTLRSACKFAWNRVCARKLFLTLKTTMARAFGGCFQASSFSFFGSHLSGSVCPFTSPSWAPCSHVRRGYKNHSFNCCSWFQNSNRETLKMLRGKRARTRDPTLSAGIWSQQDSKLSSKNNVQ